MARRSTKNEFTVYQEAGVGVVVCGINLLSRIAFSWENSKNINVETQKICFCYV